MKPADESATQTPLTEVNFDLAELLAQVTEENLHNEIDTGVVIGLEIW
jgi:antitoxin component of MazEF toxin-antitoxin module